MTLGVIIISTKKNNSFLSSNVCWNCGRKYSKKNPNFQKIKREYGFLLSQYNDAFSNTCLSCTTSQVVTRENSVSEFYRKNRPELYDFVKRVIVIHEKRRKKKRVPESTNLTRFFNE